MKPARRIDKRSGCAAAVALSLVASILGVPAAAAAGTPPSLAGRTTIKVAESSWMHVSIPADATLALGFTEDYKGLQGASFDAGGGLAAVALAPAAVHDPQPVAAVRLPKAENRLVDHVALGPRNCQTTAACDLPAGEYRLYVLTDRPLTVRLTLGGLPGRSKLRPSLALPGAASGAEHETFHQAPYTATGASAWTVGFTPEIRTSYGMLFYSFWFNGSSKPVAAPPADQPLLQVGTSEACFYDGAPQEQTAFFPGCAGGLPRGGHTALKALDDHRYAQYGSEVGVTSGRYGLGAHVLHTGIFDQGFAGFWLDLTPPQ